MRRLGTDHRQAGHQRPEKHLRADDRHYLSPPGWLGLRVEMASKRFGYVRDRQGPKGLLANGMPRLSDGSGAVSALRSS